MPIGNTLEAKMRYRINKSKVSAFILSDFYDLSDRDQVGRVLRKMVKEQFLIKIGQGIFAKTKESKLTGKRVLETDFITTAKQALRKLKVNIAIFIENMFPMKNDLSERTCENIEECRESLNSYIKENTFS